ncbi:MAG: FAD-binding domain-containing protein [Pyrinomonadaceae bacterium]|nr:FAD-binding domain-containing protein [Pyrinomonadaceae bacterium]
MRSNFPTELESIMSRVDSVDPIRYAKTRNFLNGAVTRLSPYISRGVISTRFVLERVLARGYEPKNIEKFIQELAWREYYQRVWQAKGDEITRDLRFRQQHVENDSMPIEIINANTGIEAVDRGIEALYETGYMHNHLRMYTASLACNIGRSHWKIPARWMYYHLLDGDWASNAISWQWVAGSASSKKYYANQENINRYCATRQRGTFLDVGYAEIESVPVPPMLTALAIPELRTELPFGKDVTIDQSLPTLIYNSYNVDPLWKQDMSANRVLLLEPSHFTRYPVADKVIDFVVSLGKNIAGLQIFAGEFSEFRERYRPGKIYYKEHPLNRHYQGIEESRDWMFTTAGYFHSFFGYWKKCERELRPIARSI